MTRLSIDGIAPTETNARSMVALTHQDLVRMYGDSERAGGVADPEDATHIEAQLSRLREHTRRYLGVYAARDLVAYAKVNEWTTADQAPFARTQVGELGLRALSAVHLDHLPTRPLGIFGLVADASLETDEHDEALELLMSRITTRKGDRQMRMPIAEDDPALATVLRHGFASTDRRAAEIGPVEGVEQRLYIRQPR